MNVQLTDDFNGKHYTEFTDALKKANLPFQEFKNPVNKNFLNFFISREFYKENGRQFKDTEFLVNNRQLNLEDKNLSFFSYIAKLVREIAQKHSDTFVVNRDYLDSEDLSKGICLGNDCIPFSEKIITTKSDQFITHKMLKKVQKKLTML